MAQIISMTVTCDMCDVATLSGTCQTPVSDKFTEYHALRSVVRGFMAAGWKQRPDGDTLCPECHASLPGKMPKF